MSRFENVTVVKQANVYFDGGVTSRTLIFPDGSRKTLGLMQPGEYEFDTAEKEIVEILAGELAVLLPGASGWRKVGVGESFEVAGESRFSLRVGTIVDYCCSYLP